MEENTHDDYADSNLAENTTDYAYYTFPWFGLDSVNSSFLNNTQGILFPNENNSAQKIIELSFASIIPFIGLGLAFVIGFSWWKIDRLLDYFAELELKAIREARIRQGLMIETEFDDLLNGQEETVQSRIARRMVNRSSIAVQRGSIVGNRLLNNRGSIVTARNSINPEFHGFEDQYTRRTEGFFRPSRLMRSSADYRSREYTV